MGFMSMHRGIEADPNKSRAVIYMRNPSNLKEAQWLADRFAFLARFLPRLAEKTKAILQLLKKSNTFQWEEECESTFQVLKIFLAISPMLTKPRMDLDLLLYLSVAEHAIM